MSCYHSHDWCHVQPPPNLPTICPCGLPKMDSVAGGCCNFSIIRLKCADAVPAPFRDLRTYCSCLSAQLHLRTNPCRAVHHCVVDTRSLASFCARLLIAEPSEQCIGRTHVRNSLIGFDAIQSWIFREFFTNAIGVRGMSLGNLCDERCGQHSSRARFMAPPQIVCFYPIRRINNSVILSRHSQILRIQFGFETKTQPFVC